MLQLEFRQGQTHLICKDSGESDIAAPRLRQRSRMIQVSDVGTRERDELKLVLTHQSV